MRVMLQSLSTPSQLMVGHLETDADQLLTRDACPLPTPAETAELASYRQERHFSHCGLGLFAQKDAKEVRGNYAASSQR